ncbi:hypothetical protein Q4508_11415 [Amphritea sp. 2_MG-2023]|uniref:hypothetical protein n=1 Tax=Amphritea TaxID=515417 RepID=UPI001C0797D1|nr:MULTISPECIES: hypothetical protein [Amphritea]MBU2963921.1 hypothetical protein [Amphritea atlantica]MDO6419165.1 hypothetical protein [Amphritea sp. 2_MG-2023]
MTQALIIASAKTVDNHGSLQHCLAQEATLKQQGLRLTELVIDPLSTPWHSELLPNHYRSGCGPIEALADAKRLINSGATDAVVISGTDNLRSGYDRQERLDLMAVYGNDYPLTQAYNELAEQFILRHNSDAEQFRQLADDLFENYKRRFQSLITGAATDQLPDERWYKLITPLFRGVDCANPLIDFSGRLLIGNPATAEALNTPHAIEVAAVGLGCLRGDGQEYIEQIVSYEHLKSAYQSACQQADIDFAQQFRDGLALLEVYTCYPVVPIAFLLVSGLVDNLTQLPAFLEQHLITITGGMNLAKGPWNNPALNGLIEMHQQLLASPTHSLGAVHGNGGLGYKQGVALLKKLA